MRMASGPSRNQDLKELPSWFDETSYEIEPEMDSTGDIWLSLGNPAALKALSASDTDSLDSPECLWSVFESAKGCEN